MIHKFSQNGYNIVLDVNSGTVHALDGLTFSLCDFAGEDMGETVPAEAYKALTGKYDAEEIKEAWDELKELQKNGVFYSKDSFANVKTAGKNAPIKSMCLNIAHDCDLRCRYCFASTGDFGGGRKLMSFETGKAAIDFLLASSGTRHNLEVDFFGGEPLMNYEVVKQIVLYTREAEARKNKNVRFTMTTNGMLLDDEKIDFLNREMSNIVLSIDGRREVNDRMRVRVDGTGSYDRIIENYKKLVAQRGDGEYYVRATFTHENLDFASDVFHLADQGFDQISAEPVVLDDDSPYALRESDLPEIFSEYDRLAGEFLKREKEGRGFNFFHFMIDLDEGPCIIKLLSGCGCGNEYVAVTPDGDVYPCHQFVGRKEFILGNLHTGRPINTALKSRFADANITTKEDCAGCWAKFFCGGGCTANNSLYNSDLLKPLKITCALEQKRLECALMIQVARSME